MRREIGVEGEGLLNERNGSRDGGLGRRLSIFWLARMRSGDLRGDFGIYSAEGKAV